MADLDYDQEGAPAATFSNGPNARIGTIPVTYDEKRKKLTWYYFMAASMKESEMVRCLLAKPQLKESLVTASSIAV